MYGCCVCAPVNVIIPMSSHHFSVCVCVSVTLKFQLEKKLIFQFADHL